MKDVEASSPVLTPEGAGPEQPQGDSATGRSRGRRRTAREIAQMFEQLKQRHLARKREWQAEKEELLKQAALAEDSKRILSELKRVLEGLRGELRAEEQKTKEVEDEYQVQKEEWEREREQLLNRVEYLASQKSIDPIHDSRRLSFELERVKSQLLARERDLAVVQKSNSDIQRNTLDLQRGFQYEKQKLIDGHEGEKRNWDKTRQVMLEKIEMLQKELRNARANSFPLHGSHVGSPSTDTQSFVMSPDTDERSSRGRANLTVPRITPSECQTGPGDCLEEAASSRSFERTVDEALSQIDRITKSLEHASGNNDNLELSPATTESSPLSKSTLTLAPSSRRRSASLSPLQPSTRGSFRLSLGSGKMSVSPYDDKSDSSKSPCAHYSCVEEKLIKEKALAAQDSASVEQTSAKTQDAGDDIATRELLVGSGTPDVYSPEASVSPGSCSIPGFTESSAESPPSCTVIPSSSGIPKTTIKIDQDLECKKDAPFQKIKQRYAKPTSKDDEPKTKTAVPKKLPSLHQQLLFGSAPKTSNKVGEEPKTDQKKTPSKDENTLVVSSSFKPGNKLASPRIGSSSLPRSAQKYTYENAARDKKESSSTKFRTLGEKDFVEKRTGNIGGKSKDFIESPQSIRKKVDSNDFIVMQETSHSPNSCSDATYPPPVRPKPSFTIETDRKGNVLRMVSDPRFQKQGSPPKPQLLSKPSDKERTRSLEASDGGEIRQSISPQKASLRRDAKSHLAEGKPQQRESFGDKGKSWIKKHLSFFDREEEGKSRAHERNHSKSRDRPTSKTRSSSSKRGEGRRSLMEVSTSEESDVPKSRERFKKRRGKKETEEKQRDSKSKLKRYTRSKTDSPLEMKNLFSKFRATQFSSKKPSIVKQFERRLLENEVKVLDNKDEKPSSKDTKDGPRIIDMVRDKDAAEDDGYSGEDELEDNPKRELENAGRVIPPSFSQMKSHSKSSFRENTSSPPKVYPKPRFHQSSLELRMLDFMDDITEEDHLQMSKSVTPNAELLPAGSPEKQQFEILQQDRTADTNAASPIEKRLYLNSGQGGFKRLSPNQLSLPERSYRGISNGKRLSWQAQILEKLSDEEAPRHTTLSTENETSFPSTTHISRSVSNLVLKPKLDQTSTNPTTLGIDTEDNKNSTKSKGRMSNEMQKKAANLEKVLKKGPAPRMRRYQRSETQPIANLSTTTESDSDEDSRGMTRAKSLSSEVFTKELVHEGNVPGLTERFKKPMMSNRRLPSRWTKKQ